MTLLAQLTLMLADTIKKAALKLWLLLGIFAWRVLGRERVKPDDQLHH